MKAILIRDADRENPEYDASEADFRAARELPYDIPKIIQAKSGTVIDDPQAHMLCRFGMAIPGDDECRIKCGMSEADLQKAIAAQTRMQQGLDAYDVPELQGKKEKAK